MTLPAGRNTFYLIDQSPSRRRERPFSPASMLRYLVVLLAALVVVLAFIFDRPWLSMGAGAVLAGGLGLLVWQFWQSYREEQLERPEADRSTEPTGESLEELGIMEIRKQGEEAGDETQEDRAAPEATETNQGGGTSTSDASQSSGVVPVSAAQSDREESSTQPSRENGEEPGGRIDRTVVTGDAPVLGPLMQSLRAVLGAKTVCLLVQEELALSYRIEALASTQPQVRLSGSFATQAPLLTANMAQRSVTVRDLPEDGIAIEDLGYYQRSPSIDQVAVAPVPRPDDPASTFLVADGVDATDLGSSRSRTVLERYADIVDLILASERPSLMDAPEDAEPKGEGSSAASSAPRGEGDSQATPRPRRELIAEEMEAVETVSENLALVLVHLNRAQSIARRGEEAVASAERLFRARLEQVVPNQRIERFGELTQGIFYRGDLDAIESWVADLEGTMDTETGELEGGVSVGVAVWSGPGQNAETLRTEATEALRTAYETGTSTIVD